MFSSRNTGICAQEQPASIGSAALIIVLSALVAAAIPATGTGYGASLAVLGGAGVVALAAVGPLPSLLVIVVLLSALTRHALTWAIGIDIAGITFWPTDLLLIVAVGTAMKRRAGFARIDAALRELLWVVVLLALTLAGVLIGLSNDHSLVVTFRDARGLVYLLLALPFALCADREREWVWLTFAATLVARLGYSVFASFRSEGIYGVHTRQLGGPEFLYVLLLALALSATWEFKRPGARLAAAAIAVVASAGVFVSGFRGLWLAAGIAACVSLVYRLVRGEVHLRRWLGTFSVALVLMLVLGVVFAPTVRGIAKDLLGARLLAPARLLSDESFVTRLYSWRAAFVQIEERPVLGWGMGKEYSYWDLDPRHFEDRQPGWTTEPDVSNLYLWLMLKMGIPGVVSFLVLMTAIARRAGPAAGSYRTPLLRAASRAMPAAVAAYLALSLTSPELRDPAGATALALMVGTVTAPRLARPVTTMAQAGTFGGDGTQNDIG